jgi:hypothetical protein
MASFMHNTAYNVEIHQLRTISMPTKSDYSLWWSASEVERSEKQLNTLPLPSQKRVDALTRMSSRIYESGRSERSVLSAARTTHKRTVTLCENNTHISRTSEYLYTWLFISKEHRLPQWILHDALKLITLMTPEMKLLTQSKIYVLLWKRHFIKSEISARFPEVLTSNFKAVVNVE